MQTQIMKVFTRKNKYDTQFSSRMINFIAIIFMIAYNFKLNSFKQVEHINHKTEKQENKKKRGVGVSYKEQTTYATLYQINEKECKNV
jgi:hypothetical protein